MKARLARLVESLRDNMEANQELLDRHAGEIAKLRAEKQQIDKELNDLMLGRENLETLLKAQIEKQLTEATTTAAAERKALANLDADIDVSKSIITELRKSTVKTQNELDTVDRQKLDNSRNEVERLLKVADANQGNPAALKATLVKLKSAQDEVQRILTEQAKKQNSLAEERVELAEEFEVYRTALDTASAQRKKVVTANEEETRLKTAYKEVQEKIDEFKLTEKQRAAQSASLATKINSLQSPINQQPNQALKTTVEDLVEDIQEKKKRFPNSLSRFADSKRKKRRQQRTSSFERLLRQRPTLTLMWQEKSVRLTL